MFTGISFALQERERGVLHTLQTLALCGRLPVLQMQALQQRVSILENELDASKHAQHLLNAELEQVAQDNTALTAHAEEAAGHLAKMKGMVEEEQKQREAAQQVLAAESDTSSTSIKRMQRELDEARVRPSRPAPVLLNQSDWISGLQ